MRNANRKPPSRGIIPRLSITGSSNVNKNTSEPFIASPFLSPREPSTTESPIVSTIEPPEPQAHQFLESPDKSEEQKQIDAIKWFHHFDEETFGFTTKSGKYSKGSLNKEEIKTLGFTPELFKDKTILDIGAWDGYYSFYAEKMGAKRVLAIDHHAWSGEGWGTKDGFNLAHKLLKSNVESLDIDIYDITSELIGKFDVVLFTGVLYHLTNPMKGLRNAISVTKSMLVIETTCEDLSQEDPFFVYKPDRFKTANDKTNYYSPNRSRLKELLVDVCGVRLATIIDEPKIGNRVVCYAQM